MTLELFLLSLNFGWNHFCSVRKYTIRQQFQVFIYYLIKYHKDFFLQLNSSNCLFHLHFSHIKVLFYLIFQLWLVLRLFYSFLSFIYKFTSGLPWFILLHRKHRWKKLIHVIIIENVGVLHVFLIRTPNYWCSSENDKILKCKNYIAFHSCSLAAVRAASSIIKQRMS